MKKVKFKKGKKTLALLLAIAMLITMVPITVFAAASGDWEYWVLKDGTAKISGYVGSDKIVEIPAELDGHTVTSIADYALWTSALESVTIPNSVTSVGDAFNIGGDYLCEIKVSVDNPALSSADGVLFNKDKTELIKYPRRKEADSYKIPNSVTIIRDRAFDGCIWLTSVDIPEGVTGIGNEAFGFCDSLENVNLGNGVTSIGDEAFKSCDLLKDITGFDNITFIGSGVFDGTAYYNDESNWENGALYLGKSLLKVKETEKKFAFKDDTRAIAGEAFKDCTELARIDIPNSVKGIGNGAFENCTSLGSIAIPDGVASIESNTFGNCTSLANVDIPYSVTNIDTGAFYYCTSLTNVNIPDKVTSIGNGAFGHCTSIKVVKLGNGVKVIEDFAFSDCTLLKDIKLGNSVTTIGDCAFSDCTLLKDITLSDNIAYIGDRAFDNTAYYNDETNWENNALYLGKALLEVKETEKNFVFKDGTKVIAGDALCACYRLESVNIPDSVTAICDGAFGACESLKNVSIGNGVITIGDKAFDCCVSLKSVVIPKNVEEIGEYAFGWDYSDSGPRSGIVTYGGGDYIPDTKIPGFTIYGVKGTEAERYANDNEFKFIEIIETIPGDVSGDDIVSANDAIVIQRHIAGLETLGEAQLKNADLNGDGIVDEGDAVVILRIDAGLAS